MRIETSTVCLALLATGGVVAAPTAAQDLPLDELLRGYLAERGAEVRLAPPGQLARRYAIDLTGVIPTLADLDACAAMTPPQMFDHFRTRGPLPHTGEEDAFVWVSLLHDADHFLFSNSPQFSQVAHVRELRDQLRRVYADGYSYRELARWMLTSQAFLSRFPSPADRANAVFFLFLGRDSLASEVQVGNMWNGFTLRRPDLSAAQAETDPDYHVYDYDEAVCREGRVLCAAELWGRSGSTPEEAIELLVGSPLFVEATVDRYWERYIGRPLPGVDFPDVRRHLVRGFVDSGYDVRWLVREITTSIAYTQEMMFR